MKNIINTIKTIQVNNNKYFRVIWKYRDEETIHTDLHKKNGNKNTLWQVRNSNVDIIEIAVIKLKK